MWALPGTSDADNYHEEWQFQIQGAHLLETTWVYEEEHRAGARATGTHLGILTACAPLGRSWKVTEPQSLGS